MDEATIVIRSEQGGSQGQPGNPTQPGQQSSASPTARSATPTSTERDVQRAQAKANSDRISAYQELSKAAAYIPGPFKGIAQAALRAHEHFTRGAATASTASAIPTGGAAATASTAMTAGSTAMTAAGAAGGAGGFAALAAAAGPFVVIAGVVVAAAYAFNQLRQATANAIHSVGDFAAGLATQASPGEALQQAGANMEAFGDKIAYVIPPLAAIASTAGAVNSSMGKFMRALDGVALRYGQYSGALSQANAMSDIRQIMGDMRRSQEVGPQLARYVDVRSEVQQKIADTQTHFLSMLIPIATAALEVLNGIATGAEAAAKVAKAFYESSVPGMTIQAINDMAAWLRRQFPGANDNPQLEQFFGELFGQVNTDQIPNPGFRPQV